MKILKAKRNSIKRQMKKVFYKCEDGPMKGHMLRLSYSGVSTLVFTYKEMTGKYVRKDTYVNIMKWQGH